MATTPHFDLPFRFAITTTKAEASGAVVEQDSYEDVCNCVEAIVRTPYGFRSDVLTFGFPQVELMTQPVVTAELIEVVSGQEERAQLAFDERPDAFDQLIDNIIVQVG